MDVPLRSKARQRGPETHVLLSLVVWRLMLVLLPAASAGWVYGADQSEQERSYRDGSQADRSQRQT